MVISISYFYAVHLYCLAYFSILNTVQCIVMYSVSVPQSLIFIRITLSVASTLTEVHPIPTAHIVTS